MILRAAAVVPVSAPPIRDGFVQIAADRIVALGAVRAGDSPSQPVQNLGDVVLTPGLVNPHTHLELGCYAGQLEPAPFWDWILRLVELRTQPNQIEREQQAVEDWAWRSLRAGVTTVGDISRRNLHWARLKSVPLRKVCFVELLSLADHAPSTLAELRAALETVEEDQLLTAGVTPHAPYSVPADQIRAAIELAAEKSRPWTTHWAESPEEIAFLKSGAEQLPEFVLRLVQQCGIQSPRLAPIAFLKRCAAGLPAGALAHVNYIEDAEIEPLAAARHTVVYCPRAHRFFGHPPHPLPKLRAAGVRVAIGTDSPASNDDLSVLNELRHVRENVADPPSPASLLRMATLDAAHALSLHEKIGSLEIGKQADLAAFPCKPDESDPIGALIANPPAPSHVWVAGKKVI